MDIQKISNRVPKDMTNSEVVVFFNELHTDIEGHALECRCDHCLYFEIIGAEKRVRGIMDDGAEQIKKDASWNNTLRDGSRRVYPRSVF